MNQTIISISPSNNFFGFAIMNSWEVITIVPVSFKGLSQDVKTMRLKEKIRQLIEVYRPELAVIEKLEWKRKTRDNKFILAQTVGIITALGLPVKFLTAKKAKKALCGKRNPSWQEVVDEILTMPDLTSLSVKNFLRKLAGNITKPVRNFRLYPLTDYKRYYWNAFIALILGLAYFADNNDITYDYTTTKKTRSPFNGDCR